MRMLNGKKEFILRYIKLVEEVLGTDNLLDWIDVQDDKCSIKEMLFVGTQRPRVEGLSERLYCAQYIAAAKFQKVMSDEAILLTNMVLSTPESIRYIWERVLVFMSKSLNLDTPRLYRRLLFDAESGNATNSAGMLDVALNLQICLATQFLSSKLYAADFIVNFAEVDTTRKNNFFYTYIGPIWLHD